MNHVLDRGPTNSCVMAFAQQQGLLWAPRWGPFHDLWNAVKSAAKKVDAGGWWLQIMRFASGCNLNHGPVRSGAWDNTKQNTLKTTLDTRTESSDDFREAARRTAALLGSTADSEADFSFWWVKIATLPSCHMATTFLVIISLLHMAYMTTTFQPRASKPVKNGLYLCPYFYFLAQDCLTWLSLRCTNALTSNPTAQ